MSIQCRVEKNHQRWVFFFFHFKPSIAIWFFQISNSGKALDVRKLHTRQDPWIWRRAGVKLRNSLIVLSLLLLFACLFVCLFVCFFLAFFVCLFFIFWGGLLPHGAFCVMWEDRVYFCVIRAGCPPIAEKVKKPTALLLWVVRRT